MAFSFDKDRRQSVADILRMLGLAIAGVSLALPAYRTHNGSAYGMFLLIIGPLGVLGGHVSWFANPLAIVSLRKGIANKRGVAIGCAVLAFVLALTFLIPQQIPEGDAGFFDYKIRIGYWVWLGGLAALVLAAMALPPSERVPDQSPDAE